MKSKPSEAWLDIGPSIEALNAEASDARQANRRELVEKRWVERAALPATARSGFASAHQAVDGLITCTPSGKVAPAHE